MERMLAVCGLKRYVTLALLDRYHSAVWCDYMLNTIMCYIITQSYIDCVYVVNGMLQIQI